MLAKQPHIEATRVVRESYSSEDGLARERTIFDSRPKEDQEGGAFGGGFDDDDGGGGGRGGGIADESEISYEIPGFEDLERGSPAPAPAVRQSAPPQRQAGAQAAAGRRAISPGASLFYKMIVIIVVSFGFAALTTFIYTRLI